MVDGFLMALIIPLGILAHELGHAAVALLRTDGQVAVLVGQQPGIVRVRLGRLGLSLHIVPAAGTESRGACRYEPTPRPRDAQLIAAAGPIASLWWAIACAGAFVLWGHQLHWVGLVALGFGVIEGVVAFVYNGAAALMPSLMTARSRSDGARFQQARRAQRALRQIERELERPITRPELEQMIATKRLPTELLRGRTSMPPPSSATRPGYRLSWSEETHRIGASRPSEYNIAPPKRSADAADRDSAV